MGFAKFSPALNFKPYSYSYSIYDNGVANQLTFNIWRPEVHFLFKFLLFLFNLNGLTT